jgi:ERCC4-type nuclease
MISVDDRAGSIDLVPLLRALQVQVEVTRMDYADAMWIGNGIDGMPVTVGVELKSVSDVIACITSGRFAGHQLPGLIASYNDIYLLVYGECRRREQDGVLEERRQNHKTHGWYWTEVGGGQRKWLWRELEAWFLSMAVFGGLRVIRAATIEDAAQWVKVAHNWYMRDDHKSHQALSQAKELHTDHALLVKPPLVRRVAAQLPGVGLSRSAAVAQRFKTVVEMANAPEDAWTELQCDDKRLGTRGRTIFRALRGGNGV